MNFFSSLKHRMQLEAELKTCALKCTEDEELIRIIAKALDLVPIAQINNDVRWIPSDEAVVTIKLAKDRLDEWRTYQNGS